MGFMHSGPCATNCDCDLARSLRHPISATGLALTPASPSPTPEGAFEEWWAIESPAMLYHSRECRESFFAGFAAAREQDAEREAKAVATFVEELVDNASLRADIERTREILREVVEALTLTAGGLHRSNHRDIHKDFETCPSVFCETGNAALARAADVLKEKA